MEALKDVSLGIESVSVTTASTTLPTTIKDSWSVDALTARLAPLGVVEWNISQTAGSLISTLTIPAGILDNNGKRVPLMQSTLAMFHYYKCDFTIHITVEGSAFHSGRVIIATDPLGTIAMRSKSATNTNIEDVKIATGSTFVDMDISTDTKSILEVPFQSQFEALTTQVNPAQRSSAFLSNILVFVLNPLKCASAEMSPSVNIRFFAEGKDMQINMQRFPISPTLEYQKPRTVGPNEYRVKAQAVRIVSVDSVPVVKAHDIVTTPATHSVMGDPADLYTYISAPSLVDSFTWGQTKPEDILHSMHVHPLVNSPASLDRIYHSRLGHVASAFNYWTGSLNYHFTVASSGHHRGRFGVAFVPFVTPNALNVNDLQTYSHVIFDINEKHDFSISVKFIAPTAYASTTSGRDDLADVGAKAIGNLVFFVVNPVRSNLGANDEVTVNIYLSAGSDFRLISLRQIRDVKSEVFAQGFNKPVSMDYGPGFKSLAPSGRAPLNINELARNFGIAWKINLATATSGLVVPVHFAGNAGNNASMLAYGASIFAAWKGDLKFRFTFSGIATNRTGGGHVVYAWHEPKKNHRLPSSTIPGTFGGMVETQMIATSETMVMEFVVPYASRYTSLLTDVNSEVSMNQIFNGCIELSFVPAFHGDIMVEVAAGDNFQFQIPVAPVPLIYHATPLNLANGPKLSGILKPGAVTAIAQSRGSLFKRKAYLESINTANEMSKNEVVITAQAQAFKPTTESEAPDEISGYGGITKLLSLFFEHIKVDTLLSFVVEGDSIDWQDVLKNFGLVLSMLAAAAIGGNLTDVSSLKNHVIILVSTLWSPFLIRYGLEVVPIILLLWDNTLLPIYRYFASLLGFNTNQSDSPQQVRKGDEPKAQNIKSIFRPLAYGLVTVISLIVSKCWKSSKSSTILLDKMVAKGETLSSSKEGLVAWATNIVAMLREWIFANDDNNEMPHERAMVILEETEGVSVWSKAISELQNPESHVSFTSKEFLNTIWGLLAQGRKLMAHPLYNCLDAPTQMKLATTYTDVYNLGENTYLNLDPESNTKKTVCINVHGPNKAQNALVVKKICSDIRSYYEFQSPSSYYAWNKLSVFRAYFGQPIVTADDLDTQGCLDILSSVRSYKKRVLLGQGKSGEFIAEFIVSSTSQEAIRASARQLQLFDVEIEVGIAPTFVHDANVAAHSIIASKLAVLNPQDFSTFLFINEEKTELAVDLTYERAIVEVLCLCDKIPRELLLPADESNIVGRSVLAAKFQRSAKSIALTAKAQGKRKFDTAKIFNNNGLMESLHVFLSVNLRDHPTLTGGNFSRVITLISSMDFLVMYTEKSLQFHEDAKQATIFCAFSESDKETIIQVAKSYVDWLYSSKKSEVIISSLPLEHRSTVCNIISTGTIVGDQIVFSEKEAQKWVDSLDLCFKGKIIFAARVFHQESALRTRLNKVGLATSAYFSSFKNRWEFLSPTSRNAIKVTGAVIACASIIGMVHTGLSFYRTEPPVEEEQPVQEEIIDDIAGYLNPALGPIHSQSDGPFVSRTDARPRGKRNPVQYGSAPGAPPVEWVSAQHASVGVGSQSPVSTAFEFKTLPSIKAQFSTDSQATTLSSGTYANALGQMMIEIDPTKAGYGALLCCVFIGFDLVLLPGHAMINLRSGDQFYLEDGVNTYALKFNPANVFRVGNSVKDAIIYRCGKSVAAHAKIYQHFITNKDVENYKGGCGTLLGVKIAQGKRFIMNTTLSKIERIDHSTSNVAYKLDSDDVQTHTLAKGWQYPARAMEGDCGSLLIRHNPNKSTKLMGFHVASDMSCVTGYAEIITQEDIAFTLSKMDVESNDPASVHSDDLINGAVNVLDTGAETDETITVRPACDSIKGKDRQRVEKFLFDYFEGKRHNAAPLDMISTLGFEIEMESHEPREGLSVKERHRNRALAKAKLLDTKYFDGLLQVLQTITPMRMTRKEIVFAWVRACLHSKLEPDLSYFKIVIVDTPNPTI